MARPTREAMTALKRLVRYLLHAPRVAWLFKKQKWSGIIDGISDTDFAGCLSTRRSTTGMVIRHGQHTIRTSSTTQTVVALSSAEAEFYGAVKTGSNLVGAKSMAQDLGLEMTLRLWLDSSAALGVASRRGVGRIRHLHTAALWLQGCVSDRILQIKKVKGAGNIADLLTKHLASPRMKQLLGMMHLTMDPAKSVEQLRSVVAPTRSA